MRNEIKGALERLQRTKEGQRGILTALGQDPGGVWGDYAAALAAVKTEEKERGETSGAGSARWETEKNVTLVSVTVGGAAVQEKTPAYDAPVEPVFSENTTLVCGDSSAVAPKLLAIPATAYRDTWDAQTGKGERRIRSITFSGGEAWQRSGYSTASFNAFFAMEPLMEGESSVWECPGMCTHLPMKSSYMLDEGGVTCGINNRCVYFFLPGEVFPDAAAVKAWLAQQHEAGTPVTVWYPVQTPQSFEEAPQPLTALPGSGSVTQTGGTVEGCPITVVYETGGAAAAQEMARLVPRAEGVTLTAAPPYGAVKRVTVEGEAGFRPWNLRAGREVWGLTGTLQGKEG